jgi:alanyl-tRNA synthetase
VLIACLSDGKPQLHLGVSKELSERAGLDASKMVRELAKEIRGGGGGQAFYASAGGSYPEGLPAAMEQGRQMIREAGVKMSS